MMTVRLKVEGILCWVSKGCEALQSRSRHSNRRLTDAKKAARGGSGDRPKDMRSKDRKTAAAVGTDHTMLMARARHVWYHV